MSHNIFPNSCSLWAKVKKKVESATPQMTTQHGSCALHDVCLRLQKHNQNTQFLTIFHCNDNCTNASQCYIVRTSPLLCNAERRFQKKKKSRTLRQQAVRNRQSPIVLNSFTFCYGCQTWSLSHDRKLDRGLLRKGFWGREYISM